MIELIARIRELPGGLTLARIRALPRGDVPSGRELEIAESLMAGFRAVLAVEIPETAITIVEGNKDACDGLESVARRLSLKRELEKEQGGETMKKKSKKGGGKGRGKGGGGY